MRTADKNSGIWNGLRKTCAVSAAVWMAVLPGRFALAGPEGEQVIQGSVGIQRDGSQTQIQAGDNSIIGWQSFDIQQHESVEFIQPSAQSRVMNRVLGVDPTVIAGSLLANGQVYILNQAGVYFGGTAIVDVGALYAAAGSLSNTDFLSHIDNFTALSGSVENWGQIRADVVALLGQHVANHGTISSADGLVAMVSGNEVRIGTVGGSISVVVAGGNADAAGVTNTGTIDASEGRVVLAAGDLYSLAVLHPGVTRARDVRVDGGAGGVTEIGGTLDASSATGRGGSVQVTGDTVAILDAHIDASGPAGGGEILIGGDYQGSGELRNARTTVVDAGSTLAADSTADGDGGKVIVWADGATGFGGNISARGAGSGDGGFAEVSGKQKLVYRGHADLAGENGALGTLLLDPGELTVTAGAVPGTLDGSLPNIMVALADADGTVAQDTLEAQMSGTHIMLQADSKVTIEAMNAGVLDLNTDGTGSLSITSGDVFTMNTADTIRTAGGPVTISGQTVTVGALDTGAGAVNLTGTTALNLENTISAGSLVATGPTTINTTTITTTGDQMYNGPVTLGASPTLAGATPTFSGVSGAGKDLTLSFSGPTTIDSSFAGLNALTSNGAGTTSLNGLIVTAGAQTYDSDVTLTGATTLLASAVELNKVDGAQALSVVSNAMLNGPVGTTDKLTSLQVTGTTALNDGEVRSTGTQVYVGDVTLGSNVDALIEATSAQFAGKVLATNVGTERLDVTGGATFTGNVGELAKPLEAVTVSGTTILPSQVFTTLEQTYANVNLGTGSTLTTGATATVGAVTGAGRALAVKGNAVFNGAIGAAGALSSVNVTGTTQMKGGSVAAGTQTYTGLVTLDAPATQLTGTTPTFTGGVAGGGNDLTLGFSGPTTIDAAFANIKNLTSNGTGTTNLSGNVTTSGTQTYSDDVELQGVTLLTATGVELNKVDGAQDLIVNAPATLKGAIGSVNKLNSLQVTGATTINGGPVNTTGAQLYNQDVTLGADTNLMASGVTFVGAVKGTSDGGESLTIDSAATFAGNVGTAATRLEALSISQTTTLPAQVHSSTSQTYTGAVTLGPNATLGAGTDVEFKSSVTGAVRSLIVNAAGKTSFGGAVNVASLTTDAPGTTEITGGSVTASGDVSFNDDVVLDAAANATTVSGANVGFAKIVRSATDGEEALTVDTSGNGVTTFGGAVGDATKRLASLETNADGTTALAGGSVNTIGTQSYGDPLSLGADTTLTGTTGTFNGVTGNNRDLTLSFSGLTSLDATFGGIKNLTSDNGGTTNLTGTISTSGSQSYDDAVTLSGAAVAATSTGDQAIDFTRSVTGAGTDLSVDTTGTTSFGVAGGAAAAVTVKSLITNAGGTTNLNGGSVAATGDVNFNDAVVLDSGSNATTIDGANVGFGSTVRSATDGEEALDVNSSGAGVTTFGGAVGDAGKRLASLATNADGTTAPNGGSVNTSGAQTYGDPLSLGADTTLEGTTGSFAGVTGNNHDLTLSFSGLTSLDATFAGIKNLTSDAGGTTNLTGTISTSGSQSYDDAVTLSGAATVATSTGNQAIDFKKSVTGAATDLSVNTTGATSFGVAGGAAAPVTVKSLTTNAGGTTNLNGGSIAATGDVLFNDAVVLDSAANTTTVAGANVSFADTVRSATDGEEALVVDSAGTTTFGGAVGDAAMRLASLTTNAGGTTAINGSSVTTTGNQSYGDPVTLGADTVLTGNTPSFAGVTGNNQNLTLSFSGPTSLDATFAGIKNLTSNGGGTTNASGAIVTSGAQQYDDAVTLGAGGTTFDGSAGLTFNSTISGNENLALVSAGTTTLNGDVNVKTIQTDLLGTTQINAPSITTTDFQNYRDAVAFGPGMHTLTAATSLTFENTLSGPGGLVAKAGAAFAPDFQVIYFFDDVGQGAGNELASLTAQTANDQYILFGKAGGNKVTTAGDLSLNANGRTNPSQVATVYSNSGDLSLTSQNGNVVTGAGERITALGGFLPGNLTLKSGSPTGKVTVGDLSGNVVTIDAKTLEVLLRNAGPVLQSTGLLANDSGVDIVGNAIDLTKVGEIKLIGMGKATFGTPTRAELSPQPVPLTLGPGQTVAIRAIKNTGTELTTADLVQVFTVLDAVPLGPEKDLGIFVAGLVPTVPEPPEPPDPGPEPPKAEDVLAWLNCAQLAEGGEVPPECEPDVAAGEAVEADGEGSFDREEFQAADAINALELYRALLRSPETVEEMRREFQSALSGYERDTQNLPMTGTSFRQYVASQSAHAGALDYLDQLAFLFDRLRTMDLLPGEFQSLREALLQELVEVLEIMDRATPEEFGEAIDASRGQDGAPTAWLIRYQDAAAGAPEAGAAGAGQ